MSSVGMSLALDHLKVLAYPAEAIRVAAAATTTVVQANRVVIEPLSKGSKDGLCNSHACVCYRVSTKTGTSPDRPGSGRIELLSGVYWQPPHTPLPRVVDRLNK